MGGRDGIICVKHGSASYNISITSVSLTISSLFEAAHKLNATSVTVKAHDARDFATSCFCSACQCVQTKKSQAFVAHHAHLPFQQSCLPSIVKGLVETPQHQWLEVARLV